MPFYKLIAPYTVGTRFIASGDSSPCNEVNRDDKPIRTPSLPDTLGKPVSIGVGTSFSASAIYRFLSVEDRGIVPDVEETINRGRAEAGPYPGDSRDRNPTGR